MKKVILLVLLSFATINFLSADEYISDAYLEEIAAQTEVMYEPINASVSDVSLDSLPIAKTIEEEAKENKEMITSIEPVQIIETRDTLEYIPLVEENNTVVNEDIPLSPYFEALKEARDEHKIIMIVIRATNCHYCNEMEAETLTESSVKSVLKDNFITVHYNQDLEPLPLALQKGVTPNFIFVNTNEDILNIYPGMRNPAEFTDVLEQILSM